MTDHIVRITDRTNVFSYLVRGEERAALIDTGTGFGDMFALTAQLTDLPIIVILTHGHCDHTSSASDDIGDGLRHKHAVGSEVEDARKEERERHDHHHFAEKGEKDGLLLLAQRFKSGLPGVLQGLKYKCEEVKMERRDRIFHQLGVSAEHGDEKGRETFDQDPDDADEAVGELHDECGGSDCILEMPDFRLMSLHAAWRQG